MAESVEKKFSNFVLEKLKAGKGLIAGGPNMDPDYSEFWAEAHPKTKYALQVDNVDWNEMWAEAIPNQLANWSEEMYHDIGPDWSEISPLQQAAAKIKDPKANLVVTARWPKENEAFYRELFKSLKMPQA
ncbi:MAG: hypothetical protein H0T56_15085 [Pseudaminobacter sp.]|nr:hypothetical protein [Pseudaminobacter sp.]